MQQSPTGYYIVKDADQPVVRSIPVRSHAVRTAVAPPIVSIDEKASASPMPATRQSEGHRRGPTRVAHLVRAAMRRTGAGR